MNKIVYGVFAILFLILCFLPTVGTTGLTMYAIKGIGFLVLGILAIGYLLWHLSKLEGNISAIEDNQKYAYYIYIALLICCTSIGIYQTKNYAEDIRLGKMTINLEACQVSFSHGAKGRNRSYKLCGWCNGKRYEFNITNMGNDMINALAHSTGDIELDYYKNTGVVCACRYTLSPEGEAKYGSSEEYYYLYVKQQKNIEYVKEHGIIDSLSNNSLLAGSALLDEVNDVRDKVQTALNADTDRLIQLIVEESNLPYTLLERVEPIENFDKKNRLYDVKDGAKAYVSYYPKDTDEFVINKIVIDKEISTDADKEMQVEYNLLGIRLGDDYHSLENLLMENDFLYYMSATSEDTFCPGQAGLEERLYIAGDVSIWVFVEGNETIAEMKIMIADFNGGSYDYF